MARSKLTWIVVVWMAVLTLLPAYLLLSRKYTLIRNDGNTNNSELQSSQKTTELEHFKTQSGELNTVGSDRLQAELERILTVDWSDPRAPFEQVVALSSLLPKITDISRMKTPSPEAFRNYIAPIGLPVIFTDMLEGQLLSRWNWDYVKTKWGDHIFHNTRQGNYSTKTTKAGKYDVNRVSVRLADFIDVVTGARDASEAEKGMYITKQRVIPVEALEREFYYPPFYPGSHKNCYLEPTGWYVVQHNEAEAPTGTLAGQPLFCKKELACETTTRLPLLYDNEGKQVIGASGTFTQGHIDSKDNFVYQIIGEKRWTIFSPVDYQYLYYTKGKGSLEWSAALSTTKTPDLDKYPLYAKATPVTFTMKPGEVLYLPRGWTHTVENVSPALMINTWRYGPAHITWFWSEKSREDTRRRCF